jgi:phenylalanyl-tRNA synthetase beta chain
MKISVEWMKEYGAQALDISIEKLTEKIGSQLGAIEETINLGDKYKGILVAKVAECVQHPNADRLYVCMVDDGGKAKNVERDENGYVQVVCGAPNVKAGLMVAWLPPGTTVPSSFGGPEPFVLEARDLRGQKSNGMLASPKELALGDSHEGILVIDEKVKPGEQLADIYKLGDYIIDIENKMFTHRPDCFGVLGVAREIAGIQNISFTSPEWYKKSAAKSGSPKDYLPIEVKNDLPDLVPHFMAQVIRDVTIEPSPIWLQSYLSRVGVRPINNVVDVTNYMMLLTGQPLHAYDYDKVLALDKGATKATLLVRRPKPEEKIDLLGGKQIELNGQEILISTAEKAIGLGGIMGGSTTEVDDNTKSIILECATFDMYTIRRASMAHGLFTDAVTRFNKGQSPKQNDRIIVKASEMIVDLGGGEAKLASDLIDIKNFKDKDLGVKVNSTFVNERLGLDLNPVVMQKLLQNVEFVVELSGDELSVVAPFWRTDIEIPEDIVEEIGRLHGFDHLPQVLPSRLIIPATENRTFNLKSSVRSTLSSAGANEVLTYTFVHGKLLQNVGQDSESAFELNNALSPDLQYYRMSLTPSLLEKVYPNLRSDYVRSDDNEFALFEINKVSNRKDRDQEKLPKEYQCLSLVFAADTKTAGRKYQGAAYYAAKKYLTYLLVENRVNATLVPLADVDKNDLPQSEWVNQLVKPFDTDRSAVIMDELGKIRGIVGEFSGSVKKTLKLPGFCSGFELDVELLKFVDELSRYTLVAKFPKVEQDLTLRLPTKVKYDELYEFIWQELESRKPENSTFAVRPLGIYQADEDSNSKNISFRLWISAEDRTLTTDIVNTLLDDVSEAASKNLKAERV